MNLTAIKLEYMPCYLTRSHGSNVGNEVSIYGRMSSSKTETRNYSGDNESAQSRVFVKAALGNSCGSILAG